MTARSRGIIPARAGFTGPRRDRWARRRDHPRSRGVYGPADTARLLEAGSSPLARGLRRHEERRRHRLGIIPARAGFTGRPGSGPPCSWDHPRSRGVYPSGWRPQGGRPGSSPLARGLLQEARRRVRRGRIIPARAGFTRPGHDCGSLQWDHPRSRGVYWVMQGFQKGLEGSSPLARGLRAPATTAGPYSGIIPARAGFTHHLHHRRRHLRDHPRSRGVYSRITTAGASLSGSSPLARGLPPPRSCTGPPCRIIPARAGFTRPVHVRRVTDGDHPRSRGVYPLSQYPSFADVGSSPLARGLPAGDAQDDGAAGIIPARAGFTNPVFALITCSPDHPRSRGVYCAPRWRPNAAWGSSPLARGLQDGQVLVGAGHRIIPARAGFTRRSRPRWAARRDHPRSRGVYSTAISGACAQPGSSPLARGLPWAPSTRAPATLDHPRSRGVYQRPTLIPVHTAGSSPLARGLRLQPGR